MQNKANLPDTQMNASHVKTKNYEQKTTANEPIKQTQSNPTCGEHNRTIYGEPACTERTCGELVESSQTIKPKQSQSKGGKYQG